MAARVIVFSSATPPRDDDGASTAALVRKIYFLGRYAPWCLYGVDALVDRLIALVNG